MHELATRTNADPIDLAGKLRQFDAHWQPKPVAGCNGHDVMVVKALGDFDWHIHEDTDDFFLVLSGVLTIHLRDHDVRVGAGELYIVPAGDPSSADIVEAL